MGRICSQSGATPRQQPEVSRGATWGGPQRTSLDFQGSCAVGDAEPCFTCTIRASRANGPSIGVVPTRASLEEQTGSRVRALALDRQAQERFLQALQPDQGTLALAALAPSEQG